MYILSIPFVEESLAEFQTNFSVSAFPEWSQQGRRRKQLTSEMCFAKPLLKRIHTGISLRLNSQPVASHLKWKPRASFPFKLPLWRSHPVLSIYLREPRGANRRWVPITKSLLAACKAPPLRSKVQTAARCSSWHRFLSFSSPYPWDAVVN